MSFLWREYLALAEALMRERATLASEEACCRAAISRAYYAAHCAARNHARDNEQLRLSRSGTDHGIVIRHYNNGPSTTHRRIGQSLRRMRIHRGKADYDDSITHAVSMAQFTVRMARQVFAYLPNITP